MTPPLLKAVSIELRALRFLSPVSPSSGKFFHSFVYISVRHLFSLDLYNVSSPPFASLPDAFFIVLFRTLYGRAIIIFQSFAAHIKTYFIQHNSLYSFHHSFTQFFCIPQIFIVILSTFIESFRHLYIHFQSHVNMSHFSLCSVCVLIASHPISFLKYATILNTSHKLFPLNRVTGMCNLSADQCAH